MLPEVVQIAALQQVGVPLLQGRDRRNGHQVIAPCVSDLVLHVSLLMAAIGVAKGHLEPEMGLEPLEQLRQTHQLTDPSAGRRSVVDDQAPGHALDMLKDVHQALAQALRSFPQKALDKGRVALREGDDQVLADPTEAVQDDVAFAKVRLGFPGVPLEFKKAVSAQLLLLPI